MEFKDIDTKFKKSCLVCTAPISDSPWILCFDLQWHSLHSCSGNDPDIKGMFCQECMEALLDGRFRKRKKSIPDPPRYDNLFPEVLDFLDTM